MSNMSKNEQKEDKRERYLALMSLTFWQMEKEN